MTATARRQGASILVSTPTFYSAYARACAAADFASLRLALVGAERPSTAAAAAFRERFGIALLEGYGATEMRPAVAVNLPDVAHWSVRQTGTKAGTVGHPLPGVVARVVDIATGEMLLEDREGMLLLKSPARMSGYLDDPERTREVLRDGWSVNGDVAAIDGDGFITITGRLSRFTRIAGEMVPHGTVESALADIAGITACCVTSAPDARRGERLVAFYSGAAGLTAAGIAESLGRCGLTRLWLPKQQDIHPLPELPILATGKVDLGSIRKLAQELAA